MGLVDLFGGFLSYLALSLASFISEGIILTLLTGIEHWLESLNKPTRYASVASCRAAVECEEQGDCYSLCYLYLLITERASYELICTFLGATDFSQGYYPPACICLVS